VTAVDVHGHCVPRAFLDEVVASQPFGVGAETRDGRYLVTMPGRETLRPIGGVMLDSPHRLDWMASQGLTHQIVGPWLDIQGQELPVPGGAQWARLLNEALAETVAASAAINGSPVLSGYATVHLADAELAAAELHRAVTDLGLRGAMIPVTLPSGSLSEPRYDAFWAAAVELDTPIMLHATTASSATELLARYPSLRGLFARQIEASLVTAELIVSGVLDRFRRLRVIAVHGGGLLPYQAGRFDDNTRGVRGASAPARLVSEIVASFYYDTVLMTDSAIRFLIEYAGPERVMVGSDFGATATARDDAPVTDPVVAARLAPTVTAAVLHGTAERVFRLNCGSTALFTPNSGPGA
jgi:aminocarboxymuconate-semialdehyde decarboxylase